MGIVMNRVRAGLADYLKSPEADAFHEVPGSEKIVKLLDDDNFLQALMDGSKKIDSSWGNPTKEGLSGLLDRMDEVAEEYGGSYDALAEAYEKDPQAVLDAIKNNDMEALAAIFKGNQPVVPTPDNMMEIESIHMLAEVSPDIELDQELGIHGDKSTLDFNDIQGGYLLSSTDGDVIKELSAEMGMDPQEINLFSASDGAPFSTAEVQTLGLENSDIVNTPQFTA